MNNVEILNNRIPEIVAKITSVIRSREDKKAMWASFKRENSTYIRDAILLPRDADVKAGDLFSFDIDSDNSLILLNYTGQAHNVLHDVEDGWTPVLRMMRGLIYSFGEPGDVNDVRLVSRGFEKFFNFNEMPETRLRSLLRDAPEGEEVLCRGKSDGHMIEYFMNGADLNATTRGKFGTASSLTALEMFNRSQFIKSSTVAKTLGKDLMTLVVELVHPSTEVHVNYDGKEELHLLAAYDTSGNMLDIEELHELADQTGYFVMPKEKMMTLHELLEEVRDRSVTNNEGWVATVGDRLVKFKYETYIGMMVQEKLSYKYIMNCLKNDRLDKMLMTLPEEVREHAYSMVKEVLDLCSRISDYKPLYNLYNENEGGRDYYRTVCRQFWKEYGVNVSA